MKDSFFNEANNHSGNVSCCHAVRLKVLLALLVLVYLSGCAVAPGKKGELPFWPKPPDTPRYIYETSLRSESSVVKQTSQEKFRQALVGEDKKTIIAYVKPYDVAARFGRVIVSDTMTNTLVMFDLIKNRLRRIGHLKHGKLVNPFGIAIDHLLNIYVADEAARTIRIYDDVGFYLGSVGDSTTLIRPVDVAANPTGDRIYVVDSPGIDSVDHRIVIFDREGTMLRVIGTRGNKDGEFNLPTQAAVAPDGTLYVLDAGNFRIQVFDQDGNFLRKWGKVGRDIGDFARPRGIAIDDSGNVYVTDAAYRNFQIFNPQGKLLMFIGDKGLANEPGQYAMPAGIAVDETNRIYIVDQMHNKIEVIRPVREGEAKRLALKYRRQHPSFEDVTAKDLTESFPNTSLEETYGGKPGQSIQDVVDAEKERQSSLVTEPVTEVVKQESQPDAKSEVKSELKSELKSEVKPEIKSEGVPAVTSDVNVEASAEQANP